jgi:two-component system LytT family response regulator
MAPARCGDLNKTMSLQALVIDDNLIARMMNANMLEQTGSVVVVDACGSALEAYRTLSEKKIDFVFLDVEMPGMTGLELQRMLPEGTIVVFCSSKPAYATEAFAPNVADFIVKPLTSKRLLLALGKVKQMIATREILPGEILPSYIFLREGAKRVKVAIEQVLWVESQGDDVRLVTSQRTYTINDSLQNVARKLPAASIYRVHPNYLVALNKIDSIEPGMLVVGGTAIPIAADVEKLFLKKLQIL